MPIRTFRWLVAVVVALALMAVADPARAGTKGDAADGVQAFTRDVYAIVGSTLRHPDDTTADDAPLFNVAGVNLDLTWGQWRSAGATSTMIAHGPHTDADITLSGLVPSGVYSLFYVTLSPDTENALCPGTERGLPLPSRDKHQSPDADSFIAGADGTASFSARIEGHPLDAYQVIVEVIYHFDGQTWGALPNHGEFATQGSTNCRSSYGEDAFRQSLILQKQ